LRSCTIEQTADAFRVELEAVQDDGRVAFAWRGEIEGKSDGTLTFAIDGVAEHDFEFRRIGICVLHPWRTYVGATFHASEGSTSIEGAFPLEVVPQLLRDGRYRPMIDAFSSLDVRFQSGVRAVFAFEGERFELEDQRNWTDASFKTYPTPLAQSEPRPMRAGERSSQRVTIRIRGPAPIIDTTDDDEVVVVQIGARTGRVMPPIGLIAPGDPALRPSHLRVDVDASNGDVSALEAAVSLGVPLEVALLVDDEGRGVDAVAQAFAGLHLARLLVHLESGATIQGRSTKDVRARLGAIVDGVPIIGGTPDHFSELNRHPPDGVGVDGIAFSVSPTVHASDERSMMETLEIQGEVVRLARDLAEDLPIVVSPVTLSEHLDTPFADAWTIGSVANLVAAKIASVTYAAPTPSLAHAMALEGAELLDVISSQPRRVAAVATGTTLIIANLTPAARRLRIEDEEQQALSPYEVRVQEEAASS
jgi:hypothetical protein